MSPTQLFSCRICAIFKNTYFEENLRMTASGTCSNFAFLIIFALLAQIGTYASVFAPQFTVSFANSPFTTIDTAIIRSSRLVVFWKKVFLQISQNSQESTCAKGSLLMNLQIYRFLLYRKRDFGTDVFLLILRNFS